MAQKPENIQGIQILRALAAVSVVLVHARFGSTAPDATAFFSWARLPEAGVDLFFVISGFIMMLVSDPATGRENTPRIFLGRRIRRIVPLYWFFTLALAAGATAFPSLLRWTTVTPDLVLTSLFFIPSAHPVSGTVQPLMSVGWTLQYEMFFYLCFAAVLGLKIGARVAAIAVLFAGLMILTSITGRDTAILTFVGHPVVIEFVAGMGMYWLYRQGWVTRRAALPVAIALVPVVWLVGSGAGAPLEDILPLHWIRPIAWGVPAAMVFYVGLAIREVTGAAGRALAKLGDASYSLYLCHVFAVAIINKAWMALGHEQGPAVWIVLPLCIVAGFVSYHYIERPLGTLVRRGGDLWPGASRPSRS